MHRSSSASLNGKVTIVTGASAGVGRAVAKIFAAEGSAVIVVARRKERLRQLCSEIEDAGGQALLYAGDAGEAETAEGAVSLALSNFGRLDIVICNAGIGNYKRLLDTSVEEYDDMMRSNMRSSFVFARHSVPHMVRQKAGTLLFVSSVAGLNGTANESVYCATKFGQVGFAQALDAELRQLGIKVCVLCPGGVKTEFALGKGRTEESVAKSHMMDAVDVANTILFACTQPPNVRILQMTVRNMGESVAGD